MWPKNDLVQDREHSEGLFSQTELNHSQIIEHVKGVCMVDVAASDKDKIGV